jgi:hypothetical protein
MSIATKIYLHPSGIIRRFSIDVVSFEQFDRMAKEAFGILNNGINYQWQYQDDEDDWVSFSTEGEWKDALFFHEQSKGKLFKLKLIQVERPGITRPQPQQQQRHWGIICDGCQQKGIVGIRYKCSECDDFDFCSTCYESKEKMNQHGNHKFTKIEQPVKRCHGFNSFQDINGDKVIHCPININKQDAKAVENMLGNVLGQMGIDLEIVEEEPKPQEEIKEEEVVQPVFEQPAPVPVDMEQSWTFMEVQNDPRQSVLQKKPEEAPVQPQQIPVEVPKPVQPIPQVQPQQIPVEAFPQQMDTLRQMGFDNVALNRHLLNNYKGDLERVVGSLLQLTGYRN